MTRIGPQFGGDITEYVHSLNRLNSIPVDILLPGHPAFSVKSESILAPEEWSALLEPNIKRLESWLRDYPTELTIFLDGTPKALTEEIVYLGESQATAGYLFKTTEGTILIDPGRRSTADIAALLTQFGTDLERLRLVLITSTHPDHLGAAADLCRSTGAKLYTGLIGEVTSPQKKERRLDPDRILFNGDEFEIGDVQVTAIDSGAGDMSYLAQISGRVVLIGGDNVSRFPLGSNEEYHQYTRRPEVDREKAFYEFLKRQPVELVLPAHPRYHESPFYLPGEWQLRAKNF